MTNEQRHELAQLEINRKWQFYGLLFKTGLGISVILAWVYSTIAGICATAILMGFLDAKTGSNTVSRNTDAQNRYYELRSLQIMDDE